RMRADLEHDTAALERREVPSERSLRAGKTLVSCVVTGVVHARDVDPTVADVQAEGEGEFRSDRLLHGQVLWSSCTTRVRLLRECSSSRGVPRAWPFSSHLPMLMRERISGPAATAHEESKSPHGPPERRLRRRR